MVGVCRLLHGRRRRASNPLLNDVLPLEGSPRTAQTTWTHDIEATTAVDNAISPCRPAKRRVLQGKHPWAICREKAIRLHGQYLRRACHDGNHLEAREGMDWRRRWPAWRFQRPAWRWYTPSNTPSARGPVARKAAAWLLLPMSCVSTWPARNPRVRRDRSTG